MSVLITANVCGLRDALGSIPRSVKDRTRQLTLNESATRETVCSEGHPRGNGDGPLTTNRSLTTTEA